MLRFTDPLSDIDRVFNSFSRNLHSSGVMPMDAFEQGGTYTLRFDLPGVSPDDVDLTVEGNVLTVTAARPEETTEDVTWLLRERPAGTHRREVRLGHRLDTGEVAASYANGVLTVTVPMKEEAKSRKVAITGPAEKLTVDI